MCSEEKERKKITENPQERKQKSTETRTPPPNKQQLVTCIQLATELQRSKDLNPSKRNVYSIESACQMESDRREAWSRDFQSNSRERQTLNATTWETSAVQLSACHQRSAPTLTYKSFHGFLLVLLLGLELGPPIFTIDHSFRIKAPASLSSKTIQRSIQTINAKCDVPGMVWASGQCWSAEHQVDKEHLTSGDYILGF